MNKNLNRNIAGIDYVLTCSRTPTKLITETHITTRWLIKEIGESVGLSFLGAKAVRTHLNLNK